MSKNPLALLAKLIREGADEVTLATLVNTLSPEDVATLKSLHWGGSQHPHSVLSFLVQRLWMTSGTQAAALPQQRPAGVTGCMAPRTTTGAGDGRRNPRD